MACISKSVKTYSVPQDTSDPASYIKYSCYEYWTLHLEQNNRNIVVIVLKKLFLFFPLKCLKIRLHQKTQARDRPMLCIYLSVIDLQSL